MKKNNFILLLLAILSFTGRSYAQNVVPCYSTEMYNKYVEVHPEIAAYARQLTEQTLLYYKNHPAELSHFGRTTGDTQYYDIPVVVHVMHDYGTEYNYLSDNFIYHMIHEMNVVYAGLNTDLSGVIAPFVKYIGHSTIRFHLATVDPNGNPTHGITHHRTYLTYGGDDMAKMDLWSPANYYNIWFENVIGAASEPGSVILAYANFPSSAASYPFNDGVISRYDADAYSGYTIEHETGHYFNLLHPWNNNGAGFGQINSGCGDDDVDDTPPTTGHFSICPLYDTACAENYYKIYNNISGADSFVNYPDTANVQNIMDYSSCTVMFTKGQVQRMYGALNSSVGGRSNLWNPFNLVSTGVFNSAGDTIAKIDLKPIPEFSATYQLNATTKSSANYKDYMGYFTFPGTNINFHNETWNDTLSSLLWIFSNGAAKATDTSRFATVANSFSQSGWVSLSMVATGNHSGTDTATWDHAVFVADANATDPAATSYIQEFNPAGDRDKWPIFNYYNNSFRWTLNDNVGFDDNHCVQYVGFDSTLNPLTYTYPATGTPQGDLDDLFSIPVNLTSFEDTCNLDFFYSGASRSSTSTDINDSMSIYYSVDKSNSWTHLATLSKSTLENKGASAFPYVPSTQTDWSPMTIGLPKAARKDYVTFRFRYMPGNGPSVGFYGANGFYAMSSGNNYYMDHITFGRLPAGVNEVNMANTDIAVAPNPTNGDAYVLIKDANNTKANVVVADVTGKVVFTTNDVIKGGEAHILIPHTSIAVPGMYLVTTTTGNKSETKKLIVY
jgi:hypothetical protein